MKQALLLEELRQFGWLMKHADMQEIQLAYIFCELSKKKNSRTLVLLLPELKLWEAVRAKSLFRPSAHFNVGVAWSFLVISIPSFRESQV